MSLLETVRELCRAVEGIDWDAARADASVNRMLSLARRAPREELDAALAVIVERVARSQIEDGDGVAHVAMSGGTLVEHGAGPRPLADVLLAKLPGVLISARAFADRCRAELGDEEYAWETSMTPT